MRRQLIQTSLPVCRDITAGTSDAVVVMDQNSGSPLVGCEVGSLTDSDSDGWPDSWDDLERWRDYRSTQGGSIELLSTTAMDKVNFSLMTLKMPLMRVLMKLHHRQQLELISNMYP